MTKRPLIGIVSKEADLHFHGWTINSISNDIRYALEKNNARTIALLPPHKKTLSPEASLAIELTPQEKESLFETLSLCDGVLLQGGLRSFAYEDEIARYTKQHNIPTFGICAGLGTLVRAAGGEMRLIDTPHSHQKPELKYAHDIQIDTSSFFHEIVKTSHLRVNSIHNYTVSQLKEYVGVGQTADGLTEIIEDTSARFRIGVHFHPELLIDEDPKMNAIFDAFIAAAQH